MTPQGFAGEKISQPIFRLAFQIGGAAGIEPATGKAASVQDIGCFLSGQI
jgi:hypothetical protein